MIAENKAEFLEQIGRELEKLGVEDTSELFADFEEHFAEGARRGLSEEEICRELGNIREIARSCLDIKSSMINSMVARDVQRKKGVSLTKPGRTVPADPSLKKEISEKPENEDCVRSYTPEHISEEIYPNPPKSGASNTNAFGANNFNANTSAPNADKQRTSVGANSGSGNAAGNNGKANASANKNSGGTFEKIGKTVDKVCDRAEQALNSAFGKAGNAANKAGSAVNSAMGKAGSAVNSAMDKAGSAVNEAMNKAGSAVNNAARQFRPSDSYRKHTNSNRHSDIPPQFTKTKTKGTGGKFVDVSELKPNVNTGKLIWAIVLDIFLWLWAVPTVFAVVLAVFAAAIALAMQGVHCVVGHGDFYQFVLITRILFTVGFFALATAVFNIGLLLFKAAMSLVRHIITRHVKAIYDI